MNWMILWVIARLDTLSLFLLIGVLTSLAFLCMSRVLLMVTDKDDEQCKKDYVELSKLKKISLVLLTVLTLTYLAVPTTNQAAAIYLGPKLLNKEVMDGAPKEFRELLTLVKDYLKTRIAQE